MKSSFEILKDKNYRECPEIYISEYTRTYIQILFR